MPTYTFKKGKKTFTEFMSISEMETKLKEDTELQLVPSAPLVHSGRGLGKPSEGFKDVLKEIKSKHYKSTINTW